MDEILNKQKLNENTRVRTESCIDFAHLKLVKLKQMIACHYLKQYSGRIPSATWHILKNNSSVAAPKMCWRLNRANKTTTDKVLAGSEEHCVHNKRPQEVRVTAGQREAGDQSHFTHMHPPG